MQERLCNLTKERLCNPTKEQDVIANVQNSPRKSVRQLSRETGIPKPSVHPWGFLKDKVYSRKPKTIDELKEAIEEECSQIVSQSVFFYSRSLLNSLTQKL